MRIGYFAPPLSAPTGVADYASALLDALRKSGAVKLDAEDADLALYHIGNNQLHRGIYDRALKKPGVAILHDAVLHHFFLGSLDELGYAGEFVYNYGEWMRPFAAELWADRARSAADPRYFEYPMLKRIATASRAIVVHNSAAVRMVRRQAPEAEVAEIPHLFTVPALSSADEAARFRAGLDLSPETLFVGVFGHLRESKRLPVVIRAMHRAWDAGADARLLIAGRFASPDLERAMEPLLTDDARILRIGYLAEQDLWRYASAVDLCVNLRYPTAAETSGIAVRLMGIGKAVAFTAGEELDRIPENACLRIDRGACEEEMLASYIVELARTREIAREIGRRAAEHIAREHSPESVAKKYWEVFARLV